MTNKVNASPVKPGADLMCLYWTAPEFGQVVKLSAKSVYRLAATDPSFPCVKVGGSLRIPTERALRWLRHREQGSGSRRLRSVKREAETA